MKEHNPYINHLFQKYLEGRYSEQELDTLLAYFELDEDSEQLKELIHREFEKPKPASVDQEEVERRVVKIEKELIQEINALKVGELVAKEIQGSLSAQEAEALRNWKNQSRENQQAYDSLYLEKERLLQQISSYNAEAALERVLQKHKASSGTKRIKSYWYVAASIALFISIGTISYLSFKNQNIPNQIVSQYGDDVLPGTNRAYITLSDGSRYDLNENQTGITIDEVGIIYDNGSLVANTGKAIDATINVPRAGTYRITLSDGTKVVLNSESSLQYPTSFNGTERKVTLVGEGYFEVAHKPNQPFIVSTGPQELKVLGTHFNIKAYPNEIITSTLLEGHVALKSKNAQLELSPGKQAILKRDKFQVDEVSADDFIAWTRNQFVYNNVPLRVIFKEMERWYDVTIDYPVAIGNEEYLMKIPKDQKLSQVLASLSSIIDITFKIEGRRVVVSE